MYFEYVSMKLVESCEDDEVRVETPGCGCCGDVQYLSIDKALANIHEQIAALEEFETELVYAYNKKIMAKYNE